MLPKHPFMKACFCQEDKVSFPTREDWIQVPSYSRANTGGNQGRAYSWVSLPTVICKAPGSKDTIRSQYKDEQAQYHSILPTHCLLLPSTVMVPWVLPFSKKKHGFQHI
jgi:hypothetical protein